jgi:hypothetical protein
MAGRGLTGYGRAAPAVRRPEPANLADILERVLDKGIVIAGDIQVNLLDIELLTIKLRLVIASVDRAKEMGIDWWEHDPTLSSKAARHEEEMIEENRRLRERLAALEGEGDERDRPVERRERRAVNRPEQRDRSEWSERSGRPGRYEDRSDRGERGSRRPSEENGRG